MEEKKKYHDIINAIWQLFRDDVYVAPTIKSAQDCAWGDMVSRYEAIEKSAPPELRYYAGSMVALHVDVLERMWRK